MIGEARQLVEQHWLDIQVLATRLSDVLVM
jgi:hypothetical protein